MNFEKKSIADAGSHLPEHADLLYILVDIAP